MKPSESKLLDYSYSPELVLFDLWLFDEIKSILATEAQSLNRQITKMLKNLPKEDYLKAFQKYLERIMHCINNEWGILRTFIKIKVKKINILYFYLI